VIVAIHIASKAGAEPAAVSEVSAVAGRGLEGDRNFPAAKRDGQVTLIEVEELEWLKREHGIELTPAASRRNLATRGVRLAELVGREFTAGPVRLRGVRLCEPCGHLEKLTGLAGLKEKLRGRCGLRAEILEGGVVKVGERIEPTRASGSRPPRRA
jgi:MOSC domain-containing protein YiiM